MDNLNYLMAAYSVVWIFISGYVFTIIRRQKKLEDELENLKKEKK
ncbi:CcmD family protein [Candidatus Poribacteria bacterium]|nr:CcmD family protein [Candidatus Poribacteria bacterium]